MTLKIIQEKNTSLSKNMVKSINKQLPTDLFRPVRTRQDNNHKQKVVPAV